MKEKTTIIKKKEGESHASQINKMTVINLNITNYHKSMRKKSFLYFFVDAKKFRKFLLTIKFLIFNSSKFNDTSFSLNLLSKYIS